MAHPFEVGKMYRNRVGEYTVVEIEGDRMTIRYTNGSTLVTNAAIQSRIWENIQFEEQAAREEEKQRLAQEARLAARKRAARPAASAESTAKPRGRFVGFQESDFQPRARGIAWSSRVALGRIMANELNRRTGKTFGKWLVPLQPELHIARPEHYDPELGNRNAAFFVAISEQGATFGFCVGKPDGRTDPAWSWSTLLAALAAGKQLRKAVESVMKAHALSLDVYGMEVSYGQVAHITLSGTGFLWERETDQQMISREMDWDELIGYLQEAGAEARVDLYLRSVLSSEEAVSAGAGISRDMVAAFVALMPLYEASIGV
ncbi:MAG: hypothetical protein JXM73_08475 [Anaerolineae bacterium]|nr:hypothetical protein [Anaerolineae bacterium]